MLDITNPKSKEFIAGFIKRKERIQNIKIKRLQLEADTKKKNAKKKELKMQELKSSNREMCHCQALVHNLVSNCIGCGRIICEQEGEGDCLF